MVSFQLPHSNVIKAYAQLRFLKEYIKETHKCFNNFTLTVPVEFSIQAIFPVSLLCDDCSPSDVKFITFKHFLGCRSTIITTIVVI